MVALLISINFFCYPSITLAQVFEEEGTRLASIPGQILKAYLVAYEEFNNHQKRAGNISETGQIENYYIDIFDKDNMYIVRFNLNVRKFPFTKTGDKEILIDKTSFKIIEKRYGR